MHIFLLKIEITIAWDIRASVWCKGLLRDSRQCSTRQVRYSCTDRTAVRSVNVQLQHYEFYDIPQKFTCIKYWNHKVNVKDEKINKLIKSLIIWFGSVYVQKKKSQARLTDASLPLASIPCLRGSLAEKPTSVHLLPETINLLTFANIPRHYPFRGAVAIPQPRQTALTRWSWLM